MDKIIENYKTAMYSSEYDEREAVNANEKAFKSKQELHNALGEIKTELNKAIKARTLELITGRSFISLSYLYVVQVSVDVEGMVTRVTQVKIPTLDDLKLKNDE